MLLQNTNCSPTGFLLAWASYFPYVSPLTFNTVSNKLQEYFVSGFAVVVPSLTKSLDIPTASSTWPAAAYSLVVSSVMLPFGRLADIYGGRPVYLIGLLWLTVWSIVVGFSKNEYMLDICRALQGLGPAAFMPSGMMLLGCNYWPGPRKNLVFSK